MMEGKITINLNDFEGLRDEQKRARRYGDMIERHMYLFKRMIPILSADKDNEDLLRGVESMVDDWNEMDVF